MIEKNHLSYKKHLLVGAAIGSVISLFSTSSNETDITYSIGYICGGALGGMFWGAVVFWVRNRVSKKIYK